MEVRAAVAFEAGKPLEVTQVTLEGPKPGEVMLEIKATGHLPHRRIHPLGCRSGRPVSRDPGP
jgi:Zn-dependent alcohol dehydrogenase